MQAFPSPGELWQKETCTARQGESTGKQFLSTWLPVDPWGNDSWFLVKPTWKIVSWQFGDIHVPLGHFQVLMASWHNHGSWSCHPSSATSATLFSLGRHWGIWSYQRKASVKVCFSGILSNSTILRWQILLHGFFSHHTKIFRALWNWKSPREHYPLEENFIFGR